MQKSQIQAFDPIRLRQANVIKNAAMVVASAATMGLLAAGVSVPGPFLLSGSLTSGVALLSWHSLPSFASSPELSETPHR
jgi:hypothetical protein